ncbi:MAG: paraquat-inducible protein A [Planctomycetota bacterium]|nr:paraquat-inducible protein A [Planctomycetota bacterium]
MSFEAPVTPQRLRSCPHCGLVQTMPGVPGGMRACCARCGSTLRTPAKRLAGNNRTAAIATAALILYPLAVSLPFIRIEKFGHAHEASIVEGVSTLLSRGHIIVGLVVLLCSMVFPVLKLVALVVLSMGGSALQRHHRALTYRLVEWAGRWGMLDVLLVAILVAVLKLGDMVEVSVGPAALAFTLCVTLSLFAAASFDPHSLWEPQP